ncbi:MAG: metal-dependent hydrolase [Paracoccaceae bacterium]
MDSLTQFTLGAAVSALCLGKVLGPRRAAILGGVLGTIPDLDVFLPFDDPVDAFVLHRGWTHSLFVHIAAAPVIGEFLLRFSKSLKEHRFLVWLTVFLCFSTHAIIDAMTVYGTRLFWPMYPDPVGVGSIFIIDPLYTLPLLFVVIWAVASKHWSSRLKGGLIAAFLVSTAYLGLGVAMQAHVENRARAIFAKAGITPHSVFAIAAPFNTVVWKVIGLEDERYHNLYVSLAGSDQQARIYSHPRGPELVACLGYVDAFAKLKWFSRGYYRADLEDEKIVVSDLRMGLTPDYAFRFAIAEQGNETIRVIPPMAVDSRNDTVGQDLDWLAERFLGRPSIRKAETIGAGQNGATELAAC